MTPPAGRGPTVTIVITNYNYGRLITEAVRSALAQSRPADEILVIDDGSTDESADVLRALPQGVRVIFREHEGIVATRNAAIELVSSDWVVFLDADDLLLPHYLRRTLSAIRRHDHPRLGFAYTAARTITDGARGHFPSRRFDPALLARFNYVANTALLRRSAIATVGYSSEMEPIGHEDWDMYLSLVERGWHGLFVPRPLFVYRMQVTGRNVGSLAGWQAVDSAIRRRHPWTEAGMPRWRRLAARLVRTPSALAQRWWLTVDRLHWASNKIV